MQTRKSAPSAEEPVTDQDAEALFRASKKHAEEAARELREAAAKKASELRQAAIEAAEAYRQIAMSHADQFQSSAADRYQYYKDVAGEQYHESREQFDDYLTKGEAYIKSNPGKSLLIAVGLGFLLGKVLR